MIVSLWSLKGGAGCSVTAALVALSQARAAEGPVLLVDIGGDQPLVLGSSTPTRPGVSDWLAAATEAAPDGLGRMADEVMPGLGLVWRGSEPWRETHVDAVDSFVSQLAALPGCVVVDAGSVLDASPRAGVARALAAQATRSLLVTRACYLALSRARLAPVTPSGVILLRERDRCLTAADVAGAIGAPVVAELEVDPAVARAVDAGLLAVRPPRGVERVAGTLL